MALVVTDRGSGASDPMGVLTGDFVFVGDLGRPDLLETAAGITGAREPSARRLYGSTRRFLTLPDFMQVWPGHGAGSACGKALGAVPVTTVGYERRVSPAIAASEQGEQAFVDFILADQPEPPLYFANMKRLNKVGPPILGTLPKPRRLSTDDIAALNCESRVQIVDTRADRQAFFAAHVPGAFYAPLTKTFPTTVGSLVDPDRAIVLLADEARVEEAVRCLIRIGYDKIEGWASVSGAEELRAAGIAPARIESIDFGEFERRRQQQRLVVLDVRGAAEYNARHVPESRNIAHTRLRDRLSEIPTGEPIYVHCRTGGRAAAAAAFLARQGLTVIDVDGEFAAWQSADSGAPQATR